jgi:hypothetical protein
MLHSASSNYIIIITSASHIKDCLSKLWIMDDNIELVRKALSADATPMEELIGKTLPSVIALACGKRKEGSVNVIGTGFSVAISPKDNNSTLIATCTHVADGISQIRNLKESEGKNEGFVDNHYRIGLLEGGKFIWKIVDMKIGEAYAREINYSEKHDACICKIPGIRIQSLQLSGDTCRLASEVGIIGFPTFGELQTESTQPYILKTIISSALMYPFNRNNKTILSPRLALGCIIGEGFSGSPVISIRDGSVVGMIDYLPMEVELIDLKMTKPKPVEGDMLLKYSAGISLAIPSVHIKNNLDIALKHEMGSIT